jgi:hypothetical protein
MAGVLEQMWLVWGSGLTKTQENLRETKAVLGISGGRSGWAATEATVCNK